MFHHSKESNKPGKNSPAIAHVHLFPNTYLGLKKRVVSFSGFRWESLLGKKKKSIFYYWSEALKSMSLVPLWTCSKHIPVKYLSSLSCPSSTRASKSHLTYWQKCQENSSLFLIPKAMSYLFWKQHMSHLLPDLFGLDPINEGIQHRRSHNADISQQDVDVGWDVASKPLSEGCKDPRDIKENEDTDMGTTRVESFVASILGRDAEDSTKNKHIWNNNYENI